MQQEPSSLAHVAQWPSGSSPDPFATVSPSSQPDVQFHVHRAQISKADVRAGVIQRMHPRVPCWTWVPVCRDGPGLDPWCSWPIVCPELCSLELSSCPLALGLGPNVGSSSPQEGRVQFREQSFRLDLALSPSLPLSLPSQLSPGARLGLPVAL